MKTERTENNGRTKAFQGANGWYIATEDSNGSHYQDEGRFATPAKAWAEWAEYRHDCMVDC